MFIITINRASPKPDSFRWGLIQALTCNHHMWGKFSGGSGALSRPLPCREDPGRNLTERSQLPSTFSPSFGPFFSKSVMWVACSPGPSLWEDPRLTEACEQADSACTAHHTSHKSGVLCSHLQGPEVTGGRNHEQGKMATKGQLQEGP